jgi:hypothetical protein
MCLIRGFGILIEGGTVKKLATKSMTKENSTTPKKISNQRPWCNYMHSSRATVNDRMDNSTMSNKPKMACQTFLFYVDAWHMYQFKGFVRGTLVSSKSSWSSEPTVYEAN